MLGVLELVGIVAFAWSGALVGVVKRLDMFGVIVVGIFTALGGGIVRDVLLGVHPPRSLSNWTYFGFAIGASVFVFLVHHRLGRLRREVLMLDALGMGLFASTGAALAVEAGAGALAAVLIGGATAVGGGIIRDILVNEVPLVLQRDLYAVPALLGGAITVVGLGAGLDKAWVLVAATVVAMVLRVVALWRRWSFPRARHLD